MDLFSFLLYRIQFIHREDMGEVGWALGILTLLILRRTLRNLYIMKKSRSKSEIGTIWVISALICCVEVCILI